MAIKCLGTDHLRIPGFVLIQHVATICIFYRIAMLCRQPWRNFVFFKVNLFGANVSLRCQIIYTYCKRALAVFSFYVMSQFWHPSAHIYKIWVNYIKSKICTGTTVRECFFKYSEYKREGPYRSEATASPNTEPSYGPARDLNGFASEGRTRPCLSSRWLLLMNRPLFLSGNETSLFQRYGQGSVFKTGQSKH
jgi:hypothetical protein